MKKKEKHTLPKVSKLKIELPYLSSKDTPGVLEEIRWEDDGGTVSNPIPLRAQQYDLPLQAGDLFRVLKGSLVSENGKYYYIAKIEIIPSTH